MADGRTNKEIGEELHLAEKTVKNYVSSILSKLEVARRAEAAAYLARHTTTPGSVEAVAWASASAEQLPGMPAADAGELGGGVDPHGDAERCRRPVVARDLHRGLLAGRDPGREVADRERLRAGPARARPPTPPGAYCSGSTPMPTRFDRWMRS